MLWTCVAVRAMWMISLVDGRMDPLKCHKLLEENITQSLKRNLDWFLNIT